MCGAELPSVPVPLKHHLFPSTWKILVMRLLCRERWEPAWCVQQELPHVPPAFMVLVFLWLLVLLLLVCHPVPDPLHLLSSWQVTVWPSSRVSQGRWMSSAKVGATTCPRPSSSAQHPPTTGTCAATTSTVQATATSQSMLPPQRNKHSLGEISCSNHLLALWKTLYVIPTGFIAFWSIHNMPKLGWQPLCKGFVRQTSLSPQVPDINISCMSPGMLPLVYPLIIFLFPFAPCSWFLSCLFSYPCLPRPVPEGLFLVL